jgi:hypothetical protein
MKLAVGCAIVRWLQIAENGAKNIPSLARTLHAQLNFECTRPNSKTITDWILAHSGFLFLPWHFRLFARFASCLVTWAGDFARADANSPSSEKVVVCAMVSALMKAHKCSGGNNGGSEYIVFRKTIRRIPLLPGPKQDIWLD